MAGRRRPRKLPPAVKNPHVIAVIPLPVIVVGQYTTWVHKPKAK